MASSLLLTLVSLSLLLNVSHHTGFFRDLSKSPVFQKSSEQCQTMHGTEYLSLEDFRFVSSNIIIGTSSSILKYYALGHSGVGMGSLVAIDLNTQKFHELELTNFPANVVFRPHGMDVDSATHELMVVNHADGGEDRIEFFKLAGVNNINTVQVVWMRAKSLQNVIPYSAANSVTKIAGSGGEFYFTKWLPHGMDLRGSANAASPLDALKHTARTFWDYFVLPALPLPQRFLGGTEIYRCEDEEMGGKCQVVVDRLIGANGLASSADGKFVFAVDLAAPTLYVFARNAETGALTKRASALLPMRADNVQVSQQNSAEDGKYELSMGGISDVVSYALESAKHDKRLIASGFVTAQFDANANTLTVQERFIHDGSKLHSASTAVLWGGNKVLFTGPGDGGGVLVCDLL